MTTRSNAKIELKTNKCRLLLWLTLLIYSRKLKSKSPMELRLQKVTFNNCSARQKLKRMILMKMLESLYLEH